MTNGSFGALLELGLVILSLIGGAVTYFKMRGRSFGWLDLVFFVPAAGFADYWSYVMFMDIRSGGGDSAAYGHLAELLILLGLGPVAFVLTIIAAGALAATAYKDSRVRIALILATIFGPFILLGKHSSDPGANDPDFRPMPKSAQRSIEGEEWALESGAASEADCRKKSSDAHFIRGCMIQVRKNAR